MKGSWLTAFVDGDCRVYRQVAARAPSGHLVPVDFRCDFCSDVAVWSNVFRLCEFHLSLSFRDGSDDVDLFGVDVTEAADA